MASEYELKDFFIVLIPSRDNKMDIDTCFSLSHIGHAMGKFVVKINTDKKGLSFARTSILKNLKLTLDKMEIKHDGKVRALWFDDDVRIMDNVKTMVGFIEEADKNGYNLIGNYRNTWTNGSYINVIGKPNEKGTFDFVTDEEIASWKPYQELPGYIGGLGFYYGDINLDYVFHDGGAEGFGEDINFYVENKIKVNYCPVHLKHEKVVWL